MELQETQYRKKVQETLDRIEAAFDDIDPDIAECEQQFGALNIQFRDGSKCILSAQPSVRQLWLAVTSRAKAHHFNFDAASESWKDDKDSEIELMDYLERYLKDEVGLELKL